MTRLEQWLLAQRERVFDIQAALTAVPAIGPENGGDGELARAKLVESWLRQCGADIMRLDSADARVRDGARPNIVARFRGQSPRYLWLFAHLDTVPPGTGWKSDPFTIRRKDDFIYGRGVEDNQQGAASMLILAQALSILKITPRRSLGLVFMADEECGSRHGLRHVLKAAPGLFAPDDLYVVPDSGSADGSAIEIAEKAQLWLKYTISGEQCHASLPPDSQSNALIIGSWLLIRLERSLARALGRQPNSLFEPIPVSTFTPTRHQSPGQAINLVPGTDEFYLDCRLLPELDPNEVRRHTAVVIQNQLRAAPPNAGIEEETVQYQPATVTAAQAPVVRELACAIADIYGVEPRLVGIGGATVAAFLRRAGLPAVVWSCIRNTCHKANERSSLKATCRDAAVFARLLNPMTDEADG